MTLPPWVPWAVGLYVLTRTRQPSPEPRKGGGGGSTPPPGGGGVQLEQGRAYEARIQLTGLEAMFGSASAVKDKLTAAGFRDVVVTDKGGGNFTARGTWAKASTSAKLPSQVKEVRASSSPPKPPTWARIYQGPSDSYDVVRMAVTYPGKSEQEMGIFSNRAAAVAVARKNGWQLKGG